ncbi:Hvo_1808 family surface protein [Natrialbaceae archaeon A-CW1-1]
MRVRRLAVAVGVVFLVVLAGCTAPLSVPDDRPGDPDRELGNVAGYNATDTIEIDDPNRLSQAELEAVTYRAMARIEEIRGLRFTEDVEIEVYTRAELREYFDRGDEPADAFTNELWRAAFVVDGETDVNDAFDQLYGDAVQGFYVDNRIVIVTDDPDTIRIDRGTLVHELVHALQDQQFGLERQGQTLDERRAENGLIEGEANYLPTLYDQRCGSEWECLPDLEPLEGAEAASAGELNVGLFLSIYAPYSEGPTFVEHLHETGGWDAIDTAFEDRPVSTAQIIHPERYPDDRPVEIDVADRSSPGWEPITDEDGAVRTETVGEATLFAALWSNGALEHSITAAGTDLSPYNYSHPTTAAWAGDTFVTYNETDGPETGHVWVLEFRDAGGADRFAEAYERLLENRGADAVADADGTYRITDEAFVGAYRVTVDDNRVELVGAPTVADLEAIRPPENGTLEATNAPIVSAPARNAVTASVPTGTVSLAG